MINHNNKISFGTRLRALRLEAGYTQQNIADALKINRSTYTYYETGKTTPDVHTLRVLAQILNVNITELLDSEGHVSLLDSSNRRPRRMINENPVKIGDLSTKEKSLIALLRSVENNEEETDKIINELIEKYGIADDAEE